MLAPVHYDNEVQAGCPEAFGRACIVSFVSGRDLSMLHEADDDLFPTGSDHRCGDQNERQYVENASPSAGLNRSVNTALKPQPPRLCFGSARVDVPTTVQEAEGVPASVVTARRQIQLPTSRGGRSMKGHFGASLLVGRKPGQGECVSPGESPRATRQKVPA